MIPNLAVIHIQNPHWHSPRLWIPLFLLWIPLLILAPLVLLVLLVVCVAMGIRFSGALSALWGLLSSLSGTDVRVHTPDSQVLVQIH